jgi:prolyl oligopeptidase
MLFAIAVPCGLRAQNSVPSAPARNVVDTYFGTRVADPYRWMETAKSPELLSYLNTQGERTRSILNGLASPRSSLLTRILALQNEVTSVASVQRVGDKYYYLEAPPGSKDRRLMVRPVAGGSAKLLLNPAALNTPGSHAAITYFQPSWDGQYVVAGIALGGSEDATIRVVQTSTGELLKEAITRTQYGSPAWTDDSKSFYYMRQQELPANAPPTAIYENTRIYLHELGAGEQHDKAIFGADVNPALRLPKAGFVFGSPLPGTSLLIAAETRGTIDTPAVWVKSIKADSAPWRQIARHEDGILDFAARGSTVYVLTKTGAPNGRIVRFDAGSQDFSHGEQVRQESDVILTAGGGGGLAAGQDALYAYGIRNGASVVIRMPYDNPMHSEEIPLPFTGSVFDMNADYRVAGFTCSLQGWTKPTTFVSYDPGTKRLNDSGLQPPHPADYSGITSIEVEAESVGGVQVPLSIIYRKDLALDGSHPAVMEAYGGYGTNIPPSFSPTRLAWLERGGIIAYAHVRGGGEKGEAWHLAGQKQNKQHTIDDFVACARYMIARGYTSPAHLAVRGTSAGGIAVGGIITQHPELARAALDRVGVSDLLRFEVTQGGDANIPELGSVKVEAEFRALYAISPYHNVKEGTAYPAVLLETGLNDPRVPSWQVAKMTARLQAATSSKLPVLLRVDKDAGHGIGSDRQQTAELMADEFAFLGWQLGMTGFAPR